MSFLDLLKIEFMKVKRSKIAPLIFIAPLLVVVSGVANLSNYFTPEYTNAWAAMFIQSALVYAYYLLPFSMIVVCVMIAGRETGNNGILKMLALPVSLRIIHCQILCAYLLSVYGDGGVSCRICNRWVDCDTDNGSNRNPADPVSSEMVLGAVSDYAAVHCGYVGHHCAV